MLSEHVRIGNRVEVAAEEESGHEKYYNTKVDDIISPSMITVQTPNSVGYIFRHEVGEILRLYSFEDGKMFLYKVRIDSFFVDEKLNMMNLAILSDPEETQRREFFRFNCILDMTFDNLSNTLKDKEIQEGTIRNIGGGGLKFLCVEDMDMQDKIDCQFIFRGVEFYLLAKIVGKEVLGEGLKYRFRYRGKWENMSQRTEDRLIKCIFEEQLAQSKRG